MKPVDDERFEQAFRRARRLVGLRDIRRLHERLLTALHSTERPPRPVETSGSAPVTTPEFIERIPVESRGKVRFIPVSDVDYIAASGPYAERVGGPKRHLIREAMQTLEARLDPQRFMRIHRSAIVQLDRVDTLLKGAGGDYEVQLKGGARLRVSRSHRVELELRLGMRKL